MVLNDKPNWILGLDAWGPNSWVMDDGQFPRGGVDPLVDPVWADAWVSRGNTTMNADDNINSIASNPRTVPGLTNVDLL